MYQKLFDISIFFSWLNDFHRIFFSIGSHLKQDVWHLLYIACLHWNTLR